MKFSTASLLVAGLVLQASASPIRIIAESVVVPAGGNANWRLGHAMAPKITSTMMASVYSPPPVPLHPLPVHAKSRCAKSKTIQLSNWFRATLGMPLIEAGPHPPHPHPHPHKHHHHHHHKEGEEGEFDVEAPHRFHTPQPQLVGITHALEASEHHRVHFLGHHGKGRMHRFERGGFARRLHHALLALGPWEGRIMAFVLGCGIGVLLRMVWVLAVVLFRAVASARRSREEQAETIFIYTEDGMESENLIVPPPQYIVVDEKVVPPAEA